MKKAIDMLTGMLVVFLQHVQRSVKAHQECERYPRTVPPSGFTQVPFDILTLAFSCVCVTSSSSSSVSLLFAYIERRLR